MNKGIAAGIAIGVVLVLAALFMNVQTGESDTQVELSDEIEVTTEESKSYEVNISEGIKVGDGSKP